MAYHGLLTNSPLKSTTVAITALTIIAASQSACIARTASFEVRLGIASSGRTSSPSTLPPPLQNLGPASPQPNLQASGARDEASGSNGDIVVTGRKQDSEIVVTARKRKPVIATNRPLLVVANLSPPTHEAKRDFNPVVRLIHVRRDAKRISAIAVALSSIDGLISASCVANGACVEVNPIFGRTPSMTKMMGIKTAYNGMSQNITARSSDIDPYAARSDSYVKLTISLVGAISSMGTGL